MAIFSEQRDFCVLRSEVFNSHSGITEVDINHIIK